MKTRSRIQEKQSDFRQVRLQTSCNKKKVEAKIIKLESKNVLMLD